MELIIETDTVESAIYEGLKKINKNRNDVKITVLEKGDKDFLGLTGSKKSKIKIEYNDNGITIPSGTINLTSDVPKKIIKNENISANKKTIDESIIRETENLLKELFTTLKFENINFKSFVDEKNNDLIVEIISPDNSLIIGKYGQTLQAFQLLVNTIINKNRDKNEKKISIILDAENYREKRVKALEEMAERHIRKLHLSKKDVFFPPLNNIERKIIHNYLSNKRNIKSESIGVEPSRRIKISFAQKHRKAM